MQTKTRALLMSSMMSMAAYAAPAAAQEVNQVDAADRAISGGGLEDIVVTAQRREQRLQDVPIAVSAISATTLENSGISGTEALAGAVPGLLYTSTTGAGVPVIRGIGSSNIVAGDESSVATYVDGVYRPFRAGNIFSFNNVERVEVLKGPQGALFGRNATGGVIQVITRNPGFEPIFSLDLGLDNYETVSANAYVGTGLSDQVAWDVAVLSSRQQKGWGKNIGLGTDAYYTNEFSVRSKLLWEPSDATTVILGADYSDVYFDVPYRLLAGSVALDGSEAPAGFRDARTSYKSGLDAEQYGVNLTIDHDAGWALLKSISSYQRFKGFNTPDNDVTPLPILNASLASIGRAFTQEFQIASPGGGGIDWIVGGFFMSNKAGNNSVRLSGLALEGQGLQFTDTNAVQKTTSYSAFGQVSVPLTDRLSLTGGLRYTRDEQEIDFAIQSDLGQLGAGSNRETFNNLSARGIIEFRPRDGLMLYASYNGGFKSGLFNTVEPTRPLVRPEKLNAFELGMKSQLFDNRVRFNVAGFYYDYSDLQVLHVVQASTVLLNAGKVETYGVDADLEWAATDRLTIRGGLSWLHGRYKEFDDAPNSASNSPFPGNTIDAIDAAGNTVSRAPEWQAIAGATYEATDNLTLAANYAYTGRFYWDPDNRLTQRAVHMLNASVAWHDSSDRVGIRLWARNLLKEKFNSFATALPFGDIGQAGAPRTYGVTLSFDY